MTHSTGRRRRITQATLTFFYVGCLLSMPAHAKVDPLHIIKRQIHRANMLLVLDTSGSMVGAPGGLFSYASEVGIDCDNGISCRNSGVAGICVTSLLPCTSDYDCRRGTCQQTGDPCASTADCPGAPAHCQYGGQYCVDNTQCPPDPLYGTCSLTGVDCSNPTDAGAAPYPPCAQIYRCAITQLTCPVGDVGLQCYSCTQDSTRYCRTEADCPQSSTGNCAGGGTPPSGCSTQADCPSKKKCQVSGETCRVDGHCPGATTGYCSAKTTFKCSPTKTCAAADGVCVYPANPCDGPDNPCTLPHTPCSTNQPVAGDTCTNVPNTCNPRPNTCIPGSANGCVLPANPTDTCGAGATGTPGPIRMCRISQIVCTADSQCQAGNPDDTCGPATSRAAIAKRVLASVLAQNYDVVNFGLMTFWQGGYFPYYPPPAGGGGPITVGVHFYSRDILEAANCFSAATGPAQTCTLNGIGYRRKELENSRYRINTGTGFLTTDQNWCGVFCTIRPALGTGEYMGSYWEFDSGVTGNSGTEVEQPDYTGKVIDIGGVQHTYYNSNPAYYNGGQRPPIEVPDCPVTGVCDAKCGGRWDTQMAPFLSTSGSNAVQQANALAMIKRMQPASYGGYITYWNTPVGCALENAGAPTVNASAYHYIAAVKAGDTVACRQNYVLLVSDGAANGPGDVNPSTGETICDTGPCGATDPEAAGCTCRAVLAAWHLRQNLGTKTFVVGFAGDVSAGSPRLINDNIAKAGGTDSGAVGAPYAYLASNEIELLNALQDAIYQAAAGSYATSPSTSSSGSQGSQTIMSGKYALDSTVDFPSWKGHLLAYDVTGATPFLAWDAGTVLPDQAASGWWNRRVYTWNHGNNQLVKVQVDASTKAVTNKAALHALGLGSTDGEAENVARWMLGDPALKNKAVLGAIINSTPIDVGQPGDNPLPGGHAFFTSHQSRRNLVYVGSDDGMLHAFFSEAWDPDGNAANGVQFPAGSEAFAYIPPRMLGHITQVFAQGGQKPDPDQHLFGLAQSPKVKNLCTQGCDDASTAVWKTVLMMPDGYGGSDSFMIDITDPLTGIGVADPPIGVLWDTQYHDSSATYDANLGLTLSLPAFFLNKTQPLDEYGVIFASGYKVVPSSATQGHAIVTARAKNGNFASPVFQATQVSAPNDCPVDYALLADVGTARDFAKGQANKLIAAYYGDTWGTLYRYTIGQGVTTLSQFGCSHPLHFAPTVVQLDRDDPFNVHAREIYIVQVTNSPLDPDTEGFAASKMIFMRDKADAGGAVTPDTTFGTMGKIELTVGVANQICAVTDATGATCTVPMPTNARPNGTPLGLLRKDGQGFQVFTVWYVPATGGCGKGASYFTIHEEVNGGVAQKQGFLLAAEPVPPPAIVAGKVFVITSGGAQSLNDQISATFSPGGTNPTMATAGIYNGLGWQELQ